MTQASPFAESSQSTLQQDENSLRFTKLKPICVELLGLITSSGNWQHHTQQIYSLLERLRDIIASFNLSSADHKALSPSLINYIFFPLAQLLKSNTTGEAQLPDRLQRCLFEILSLLAIDWWRNWSSSASLSRIYDLEKRREQWKVWEQLLILGAVTLGGNPNRNNARIGKRSEETQLAICIFLQELLLPRVTKRRESRKEREWEWDGEEGLPSLEDYDIVEKSRIERKMETANGLEMQVYPCSSHLEYIYEEKSCRGAIAHAISSILSVAVDETVYPPARTAALKVSRVIMCIWLGGLSVDVSQASSLWKDVSEFSSKERHARKSENFRPKAQADRIANFLPGYVSSMVRILTTKGGRFSSAVISQALIGLSKALEVCLSDEANSHIFSSIGKRGISPAGESKPSSIGALVDKVTGDVWQVTEEAKIHKESATNLNSNNDSHNQNAGMRNMQWLETTISHVVIVLQSIEGLAAQESSEVLIALLDLAFGLLHRCSQVMALQRATVAKEAAESLRLDRRLDASSILANCIVTIASDPTSSEIVAKRAAHVLSCLLSPQSASRDVIESNVIDELQMTFIRLPDLLEQQKEEDLIRAARRSIFALRIVTSDFDPAIHFHQRLADILAAASKSDSWIVRLIWAIKIDDRISLEDGIDSILLRDFSAHTSRALMELLDELGRSIARLVKHQLELNLVLESSFQLILNLMDQGTSHRVRSITDLTYQARCVRLFSLNTFLITAQMMRGVAHVMDDSILSLQTSKVAKKLRRRVHRLAKEMINKVCTMWEEDEEELLRPDLYDHREEASTEIKTMIRAKADDAPFTERRRGMLQERDKKTDQSLSLGPAVKLDFVGAAIMSDGKEVRVKQKTPLQLRDEAHTQTDYSDSLLLSILASSAKILGPSVQSMLLQLIYPFISGVASKSTTIQLAAAQAFGELSRSAGYASVQACILSHADYVLGTASHRLVSTLSAELQAISSMQEQGREMISIRKPLVSAQSAPLVLVEVIRMLGGEALTLVQDAIDEVLDAIDRHHQQSELCNDLLSVLDRLVEVMHNDERLSGGQNKIPPTSARKMIAFEPNIDRDMDEFENWFRDRHKSEESRETGDFEMHDGAAEKEKDEDDEGTGKATPSQLVLVSILQKAVPFLSHSSATIRIRCLGLLNRGIELLCLQDRIAEPLQVISTAWPMIMGRLGFSLSTSLRRFDKVDVPSYKDLSERDFVVCMEASRLVDTLAKYLIDYIGSEKMIKQAVPRLLLLLKIVERAEGRAKEEPRKQGSQSTFLLKDVENSTALTQTTLSNRKLSFKPIQKFTPLYTMAHSVLLFLNTIVVKMGVQITEADLFAFATHSTLLSCLDQRQDEGLRRIASRFYFTTLTNRNANLVWLIIGGAKDAEEDFPIFLHRPDLELS